MKADPNSIRRLRRKQKEFKTGIEHGKARITIRMPMYIYNKAMKEAIKKGQSINYTLVEWLESVLDVDA